MFFSKVVIGVRDTEPEALSELMFGSVGYRVHQAIWKLFDDPCVSQRDFLYRYESGLGKPVFYVVSHREPTQPMYTWEIRTKPYAPQIREGERLAFSLRANPTRAGKNERDGRYARHDVVMAAKKRLQRAHVPRSLWPLDAELVQAEGLKWLESRTEGCGFRIHPDEVRVEGYQQHRYSRGRNVKLQFSTVDYTGLLSVVDPEKFTATLFRGLGHCKAFGCGMMMVRRT